MRLLTLQETRDIQLKLLLYFDEWCLEHGINYSLGEGTLIGAVRHKGFIPWDDDIDLLMSREDYNQFVKIYDGEYRLINYHTEKRWRFCFSRLSDESTLVKFTNPKKNYHGVWISIFPIDNFPNDKNNWDAVMKRIKLYQWIGRKKDTWWVPEVSFVRNLLKFPLHLLLSPFSYNWLAKQQERLMTQFNTSSTERKGLLACLWDDAWYCDKKAFDSYTTLEFEGHSFTAFSGYDIYLRAQYGDYMQLPPVEKRIAKHDYKAYIIK